MISFVIILEVQAYIFTSKNPRELGLKSWFIETHWLVVIRGFILIVVGLSEDDKKNGVSRQRPPANETITQHRDFTSSVLKRSRCFNAANP
jgi:hypothetical protein